MAGILGGRQTIRTEGTRVASFQLNASTYGLTVPVIFGTTRISGNVIDWYDFTEIPYTTSQKTGKGGGTTVEQTDYIYTVACLIGLCEGAIAGTGKVWRNKEILNNISEAGFTLFRGTIPQNPWDNTLYNTGNIQAKYLYLKITFEGLDSAWQEVFKNNLITAGILFTEITEIVNGQLIKTIDFSEQIALETKSQIDRALPYAGLAYLAGIIDLGNSGSLPTYNFEIKGFLTGTGDGLDANPADVIEFIINSVGGGQIDKDSLDNYKRFCRAADLLISTPPDTMDKPAYEIINDICQATNTISFWSQNKLKFIPLCDERLSLGGTVYEPDTTPVYDLTADNFLPFDDGALVVFERDDNSEAFNQSIIEFINRDNAYEVETVDFSILADVSHRGLRPASTQSMHFFHTKPRAQYAAELSAMKSLYSRNKYRFRLDWAFCLLEPGDLVTLTDEKLGLSRHVVIIEAVDEAEDGELEFLAAAKPQGIYSPAKYSGFESKRPSNDYNVAPGGVKSPLFFETPFTSGSNYVGVMACGQNPSTWGGATVWISIDDEAYQQVGSITAPGIYGKLVYPISETDTSMTVELEDASTQLLSVSSTAADTDASLCAIGAEWFSYETAELIGAKTYILSGLRRGRYNTLIASHASGEGFLRYDTGGFLYPYRSENIGQRVYIKLSSYNIFGLNPIPLEDLEPYTYTIKG